MLFKHAEIFTPQGFVRGAFTVEDGRFGEILPQSPDMPGTDLGSARVIPGLIDIHNHGNSGADFSRRRPGRHPDDGALSGKERRHVVRARIDDAAV